VLREDREHRWRCTDTHVAVVNSGRPFDGVANPNARGLWPRPQLQVLRPVVASQPIDVVNRLAVDEAPAEQLSRHQHVLEHVRTSPRSRMTRDTHHHISGLVASAAFFPVATGIGGLTSTSSTRRRLRLFRVPASTQVSGPTRRAPKMSTGRLKDTSTSFALPFTTHDRTTLLGRNDPQDPKSQRPGTDPGPLNEAQVMMAEIPTSPLQTSPSSSLSCLAVRHPTRQKAWQEPHSSHLYCAEHQFCLRS
jgi:hypothetical protein